MFKQDDRMDAILAVLQREVDSMYSDSPWRPVEELENYKPRDFEEILCILKQLEYDGSVFVDLVQVEFSGKFEYSGPNGESEILKWMPIPHDSLLIKIEEDK